MFKVELVNSINICCICCGPGIILGPGETAGNQTETVPKLREIRVYDVYSFEGEGKPFVVRVPNKYHFHENNHVESSAYILQ